MNNDSDSDILRKYDGFRELIKELQSDALGDISKLTMLQAGRKLRMMGGGNTLVFDSEAEADILADFALWEIPQGGTTVIKKYLERISSSDVNDDVKKELVVGMQKAFSSLFEIVIVLKDGILIRDVLSDENPIYTLVDIGIIQTGVEGELLFTRLIPLTDFCIGCGTAFPFREESKSLLIGKYKKEISRVKKRKAQMKRYTMFYKQWKKIGIPFERR